MANEVVTEDDLKAAMQRDKSAGSVGTTDQLAL